MILKEALTFDDVLIVPKFSTISSRADVSLALKRSGYPYMDLPIISANMDTVTDSKMARAMIQSGAQACLHRFCNIEQNVEMFENSFNCNPESGNNSMPMVSIGLGNAELERAEALYNAGAFCFVIDVAHGAQMSVVHQVSALRKIIHRNGSITVGNFASGKSVEAFLQYVGRSGVEGFKVGIGPGSACTTRIKTGVGYPQLSAVMDVASTLKDTGIAVIADGGMKTSGDISKALAAGAHMVMLGGMLAGTAETPGELVNPQGEPLEFLNNGLVIVDEWVTHKSNVKVFKKYRGSASKESYEAQGKTGSHRTAEGESFLVPYKGITYQVLQDIAGGIRSSFTYVGASTLNEFHQNAEFVRISNAGYAEGLPHGKK